MASNTETFEIEHAVGARYAAAAREREEALCCPVEYDAQLLEAIPREVLERDYGCGDPSRYVRPGDSVLDLGSGGGKICFIAAQEVGPSGSVIGIDMNEEMLALARGAAPRVGERIGYANVAFRRGRIQDLALDPDRFDAWLRTHPVRDSRDWEAARTAAARLRQEQPLVPDASIHVVISNCVLNLVRPEDREQMIREIHRVLRPGGRIALSDIVSNEPVPEDLRDDPELWSGCVSGAFVEEELLAALEHAGFWGLAIDQWADEPFRVVRGIEFRSVTLTGRKGADGPCHEANQTVIYRGPWRQVEDDDGHVLRRGARTAVCARTYEVLTTEPYVSQVIPVPPRAEEPHSEGAPDCCAPGASC
jgi:ubiquinone/menaquinone biosynthesis C-methylase UbiE